MATIEMQRVFRLGATDLPDPDPNAAPAAVLEHYATQYPQLRYGKVEEHGSEGDRLVYVLKEAQFKANG
ncbi:PRTRC system protein C [Marinobacter halodurans]|uniref:PRTRC system protein C n=1 Tax=Marinobacter halodurans TaxID=2528979 RepID=A0ABY1ZMD1_9GAMM|nr:PRTRC system protein C [Marinobacter halodurans]TBW57479.1 PRTRC system protein C [Marinobacter halodurans]